MANKIKYLYLQVFFLLMITACKKSEPVSFTQPGMIYFYKNHYNASKDSIVFSFATIPDGKITDTVRVPLRIMGVASDRDRTVNIQVVADSSTALEQHYTILPTIVKAGMYTTDVPLLVKRTPELKTKDVRLLLEVGTSDDFIPGVYNSTTSTSMGGGAIRFPVRISDFLTKPNNWDTFIATFFGAFSQVKYKLVIQVTGRAQFFTSGDDPVTISEMNYFKMDCRDYLKKLNAANSTELKDENGNLVIFPN